MFDAVISVQAVHELSYIAYQSGDENVPKTRSRPQFCLRATQAVWRVIYRLWCPSLPP